LPFRPDSAGDTSYTIKLKDRQVPESLQAWIPNFTMVNTIRIILEV